MYRGTIFFFCIKLAFSLSLVAKDTEWRKLQSEHFELYTADSERKGRQVLEHLETIRAAYELLTKHKMENKKRGRVVMFRNDKEYRNYALGQFSAAYYTKARGQDYVVLSDFTPDVKRILNHEYFHLFSAHAEFRLPTWLEEGLADYYSTLEITNKEIRLGLAVPAHLRYLNSLEGRPVPLAQIFAVNRENRYDSNRRATSLLYAQGWALTHMTFLGPQMMSRSQEFFREVRGRESAAEAYEKVYGANLANLDKMLANYIRQSSYQFIKMKVEGPAEKAPVEVVSMEAWEAPLILADLQLYTRRTEEASRSYQQLSAQFPKVPEIDESLGYMALQEMDRQKAVEHYRNAVEKGSVNGDVYFELSALGCSIETHDDKCLAWINEALRLDPGNRRARQWATAYALNNRRFEHALIYMVRGGAVEGDEAPDFFAKYAYAQAHRGNFADARKAIQRGISYTRKPEDLERLEKMQQTVDAIEAQKTAAARLHAAKLAGRPSVARLPEAGATPVERSEHDATLAAKADAQVAQSIQEAAHAYAASADGQLESFLALENTEVLAAVLRRMDCREGAPRLEVEAKGQRYWLAIDDPSNIRIFAKGELKMDHQFTCGPQKGEQILVGYAKDGAPADALGLLRIISFP